MSAILKPYDSSRNTVAIRQKSEDHKAESDSTMEVFPLWSRSLDSILAVAGSLQADRERWFENDLCPPPQGFVLIGPTDDRLTAPQRALIEEAGLVILAVTEGDRALGDEALKRKVLASVSGSPNPDDARGAPGEQSNAAFVDDLPRATDEQRELFRLKRIAAYNSGADTPDSMI